MKKRPKVELKLKLIDRILEIIGLLSMFGIWAITLGNYSELPETIPIHYNGSGEADRFGNKVYIIMLPVVSTVLYIGLTILNKYPHTFSYLRPITDLNALSQYTLATRIIRLLKILILIVFGSIVFKTISI